MEIWVFLSIMFAHWWADFVCQTDEMATNKSTDIWWLTNHAASYAFYVLLWTIGIMGIYCYTNDSNLPETFLMLSFTGAIFIAHWVTDFITSKITAKLWKEKKIHKFFVVIGFDQWLHAVQLLIIYKVFLFN